MEKGQEGKGFTINANKLNDAATTIDALKDFAIWMTGCGYDFCRHEYFCQKRDELLKEV